MRFGIDSLLEDPVLRNQLTNRRIALLGHPASMTGNFVHSLDALMQSGIKLSAAFGPQHGMRGDKQDNMVETANNTDPVYGIPVFSLYGKRNHVTDIRHRSDEYT